MKSALADSLVVCALMMLANTPFRLAHAFTADLAMQPAMDRTIIMIQQTHLGFEHIHDVIQLPN